MRSISEKTNYLTTQASLYGILLSEEEASLLLKHLALVIQKNKVLNLTRITSDKAGILLHILDSLLVYKAAETNLIKYRNFLDFGTGGGFPGIPLAIKSEVEGVLIDSVTKKVVEVEEFLKTLELDSRIKTSSDRVEVFAVKHKNEYDLVVARAVAPLATIIEYATPLLSKNGHFIAAKANISSHELDAGLKAAEFCGLEYVSRETYELPEGSGHRELFIFKKIKSAKVKLPRKNGLAKNQPLFS